MLVLVPGEDDKHKVKDTHETKCPRRHMVEMVELIDKEERHQHYRDWVCPEPIAKEVIRHKRIDQSVEEEVCADEDARAVDCEMLRLVADKVRHRCRVLVAKHGRVTYRHEPPREHPVHMA